MPPDLVRLARVHDHSRDFTVAGGSIRWSRREARTRTVTLSWRGKRRRFHDPPGTRWRASAARVSRSSRTSCSSRSRAGTEHVAIVARYAAAWKPRPEVTVEADDRAAHGCGSAPRAAPMATLARATCASL